VRQPDPPWWDRSITYRAGRVWLDSWVDATILEREREPFLDMLLGKFRWFWANEWWLPGEPDARDVHARVGEQRGDFTHEVRLTWWPQVTAAVLIGGAYDGERMDLSPTITPNLPLLLPVQRGLADFHDDDDDDDDIYPRVWSYEWAGWHPTERAWVRTALKEARV